MLNKMYGQILVAGSNLVGLQAAKVTNKGAKIALHSAENLMKFLAFSDLGGIEKFDKVPDLSKSVIGALGLTAATTLDDIFINLGLYQDHHLAKVGCALYAGYRLSENDQVSGLVGGSDIFTKTGLIGGGLLGASYLFGSGDMINITRSNTSDCLEFANDIYQLSDGDVNVHKDMMIGAAISGVIGGGRQFLGDLKLDIGGPLNGPISAVVNTSVNIATSRQSEKNLKNILVDKFNQKLNTADISKLDSRAHKILEELPEYIEKASYSITKNAANSGLKTAYQQILAGCKYEIKTLENHSQDSAYKKTTSEFHNDMGFSVFVTSNLFNRASADDLQKKVDKNLKGAKIDYEFNQLTNEGQVFKMKKKLNSLKDKEEDSVLSTILGCGKKLFNFLAPVAIDSILVGMMHNKDAKWNDPGSYKDAYMPVGSMVAIGESFIDVDSFAALKELQYLSDALDCQSEGITAFV